MLRPSFLFLLLVATHPGRSESVAPHDILTRDMPTHDTLTIERAITRYNMGSPLISPDGSKAVVSISPVMAQPDSQTAHLWMLDIRTKEFRQLTSSAKSENSPKWSPDSKSLAFL